MLGDQQNRAVNKGRVATPMPVVAEVFLSSVVIDARINGKLDIILKRSSTFLG